MDQATLTQNKPGFDAEGFMLNPDQCRKPGQKIKPKPREWAHCSPSN